MQSLLIDYVDRDMRSERTLELYSSAHACTYLCMCICYAVLCHVCMYARMYVCMCVHVYMYICIYVYMYICIYVYMYMYIYIYGTPPQELPTLVLYRKYRVKPAFPEGQDSVSLKDYRNQTHISRERVSQLILVRREHAVNSNTVLFQSKTNFP